MERGHYYITGKVLLAVCSCSLSELSCQCQRRKPSRTVQLLQEAVLWISVEILYFRSSKFASRKRVISKVSQSHSCTAKYVCISKGVCVGASSEKHRHVFLGQILIAGSPEGLCVKAQSNISIDVVLQLRL